MKTAIIVSLALLAIPLHAQESIRQPRPAIVPGQPPVPQGALRPQPRGEQPAELDRNLTIRLTGNFSKELEVDLAVTGVGPKWMADTLVGDDNSTLTCEYLVTEKDGAFRVEYSVGVRVAIPTQRPADVPGQPVPSQQRSVTYQDLVVRGTVTCQPGEPVEILKNGKQRVALTVQDPAAPERAPARPGQ